MEIGKFLWSVFCSILNLVYGPEQSNEVMDKKFKELWSFKGLLALILS